MYFINKCKHAAADVRRHLRRAVCILIFPLLLTVLPISAQAEQTELVSVGLNFVNNAVYSANLENVTGYGVGYELGVYAEDAKGDRKVFRSLASTDEEEITVLTDQNIYLSNRVFRTEPQTSGDIVIGAYHAELTDSFRSFDAAKRIADSYPDGFVACCSDTYRVRFGSFETASEAQEAADLYDDCNVAGNSSYGMTVIETLTGRILFELDNGKNTVLGIQPDGGSESRVWYKGNQYNGGFRYERPDGGAMHVANIVALEQYVAAVLSREFGLTWPDETMKAAACCIRTFVLTSNQHATFDVCTETCCQVYKGIYQDSRWSHLEELCRETAGERIYYHGDPILAVYHSSDGGATVSSKEAWGADYPYLQGIYDPFESTVETGARGWSAYFTLDKLTEIAQAAGFACSAITDVYVSEYTDEGNAASITFVDVSGKTRTFSGDASVLLYGRYSSRRYVIIPPGGSATVTEVLMEDGASAPSDASGTSTANGQYTVYNGTEMLTMQTIRVITANGTETVSGPVSVLSGKDASKSRNGYPSPVFEEKVIRNDTTQYMVYGSGWGHNVGLSAYGAYAMARLGYTYTDILKFYYQDVDIY